MYYLTFVRMETGWKSLTERIKYIWFEKCIIYLGVCMW